MSLLHKIKNHKKNNDPLIRLMTPMIAGILACVFCLVSMTWAWFTASVDTPMQTLQSASRSTYVKVYEVQHSEDENGKNVETKTLVKPYKNVNKASEAAFLAEDAEIDKDVSVVAAGEPLEWKLSPEKSYEVIMTGAGTASKGYCEIALSHAASGRTTPETKLYKTSAFEKDNTFNFTYNTGGFSGVEGVTETQYKEYVEKTTPPTLAIASYWGSPAEDEAEQVSLMSLRNTSEKVMLLSDGDVLGLAPIPCPEAKAETEVELEGFEMQESAVISAKEDYKLSLALKEGYEMPSEVVVNIGGKDYVVSTGGAEASTESPYYDAASGVLTVPSSLLSDGTKVSVKATATQVPEVTEEETEETTEETTDNTENEEGNSADTSSDNDVVADDPNKKEEDGEKDSDEHKKPTIGSGGGNGNGNDDDDDEADNNLGDSSDGNDSSAEDETEDEKADVKLNLSQLTINLEETKIPTNADLVLTLSAKEEMHLPEQIVITLDKTIRDENIEDEEIEEDKTEYIINTDGKDNPEGFEFDAESGELTISSELLEGVREITIADTEENEADENDEKATLTFEVKNLTFDFADDEIVTDEDVVITFTAGEGYELPETIIITIDGEEYIIYTSEEDSDKNPEGITFDTETGTLTISKDLLEDAEAITITAEGIKKEDDESEENEENSGADKKDESEDEDDDKENESEGGEGTDKEPESGTDNPTTEDKTENEGNTEVEGGENTETTNPDDTTGGEGEGDTETQEPGEPTTPTEPDGEDNTDSEQGGESGETGENGEGTTENETEETTPDTESGDDSETTIPTEPSTPTEPSEPVVTPETPSTNEPATGGNDDDNGETGSADSSSTASSSDSGNDSTESNASSESTNTATSVIPTEPTTSSETEETSSEE